MSNRKVAIITGASSGIGRATSIALAGAGWSVVLTARREPELRETRSLCVQSSQRNGLQLTENDFLVVPGDITNEESVRELFAKTIEKFGRLDLLFNNAGIAPKGTLTEDLSLDAFTATMATNVTAPFLCTREAIRIFKSQNPPGGRIINNGSLAAHVPRPNSLAYSVAKHAISGLTKSTALDGRAHNITCTQIDIGNAYTPLSSSHNDPSNSPANRTIMHLQPYGQMVPEGSFDVAHVASQIVSIANLPNSVTVLEFNIMATDMPYVGRG